MLAQSMKPVLVAAESVLPAARLLLRREPSVSRLMSVAATNCPRGEVGKESPLPFVSATGGFASAASAPSPASRQ